MNTPGIYIFNNFGSLSSNPFVNEDGFIILQKISGPTAKNIDKALSGKGIIVDSDGHVWDYASSKIIVYNKIIYDPSKTKNIGNTPVYTKSLSVQTPLTSTGLNPFLSGVSHANYFISLPRIPNLVTDPNDTGNIGGWLLSKNEDGTYYILYNPLNRKELFSQNQPASIYKQYCEITSLQDANCYCISETLTPKLTDDQGNYCYYSSLEPTELSSYNGKTLGAELQNLANTGTNMNLASTINTIKAGCNCMGTCRTLGENNSNIPLWTSFKNLFDIGTCPATQNFEISACTTDIKAGNTANINSAITLSCPTGNPSTPSTPVSPIVPSTPSTPVSPVVPSKPSTPVTPPVSPTVPVVKQVQSYKYLILFLAIVAIILVYILFIRK